MGAGSGGAGGLGTALYFMRREDQRIADMLQRNRRRLARKARRAARREDALGEELDEVESDLGRMLLLAMTVNRIFLQKNLLTSEELAAVARKLDLADGRADGKLDPATVRPRGAKQAGPAASPDEFLRDLQQKEKRP